MFAVRRATAGFHSMFAVRRATAAGARCACPRSLSSVTVEKYTERQNKLGRPVSPHVTTYAFPVVAASSITQRVTGVLLSVGVGGVAGGALAGVDVAAIAAAVGASGAAAPAKFTVAFPLVYHFLGGVRHTLWDRNPEKMLNNKDAERSSYLLIGSSAAAAVGLAAASFK